MEWIFAFLVLCAQEAAYFVIHYGWVVVLACAAMVLLALVVGKSIENAKTPEERAWEDEDQARWVEGLDD